MSAPVASTSTAPSRDIVINGMTLTTEKLSQLVRRLTDMRAAGQGEEVNPEAGQIWALLKTVQAQQLQHNKQAAGPAANKAVNGINGTAENGAANGTPSPSSFGAFSPAQSAMLKCQLVAFRYLSRNQPMPAQLQQAVGDPALALQLVEADDGKTLADISRNDAEEVMDIDEDATPETNPLYPYNAFRTPLDALHEAGVQAIIPSLAGPRHVVLPTLLPHGVDPYTLRDERKRIIESRVYQRIRELEALPATLPDESTSEEISSQKIRALIEVKGLRLLGKQQALREQVVRGMGQATQLSLTADRSAFRRVRKPNLHDARTIELWERKQKQERDRRMRQKHLDRLQAVATHGDELRSAHQAHIGVLQRLGKLVTKYHNDTEREETRRIERVSKERLRALKNDDEEAYLKLIDKTKDTRITHLIKQTDQYLDGLAQAVVAQQNDASVRDPMAVDKQRANVEGEAIDEAAFGAAPVFEEEEKTKVDYYNVAHAIKETVSVQPTILTGGQLKEYQLKGLQWMISLYNNRLNGILADEMGLGKTIQSIALICYLIEVKRLPGPFIIIVPLSTMTNWEVEFSRWAPSVRVVAYKGGPAQRRNLSGFLRPGQFNVCLTTYEYIIKDRPMLSKISWAHMIIDEGQRMKNTQSKLSQTIAQYYKARYRLILTGTPLQNNLPELWALLNFVLPKVFNSVKSFDEWFNAPFANTGGQEKIDLNEEEALLVIRRLHKVLRPFLLRRLKKDVEADLPDKVERIIKCKMSALQHRLYRQVKDFNVLLIEDGMSKNKATQMAGLNNQLMQLRKICNHPFVFREVETTVQNHLFAGDPLLYRAAGKVELLDRILPKMFATGHRILMFFQMTQIMDIVQDWLKFRNIPNLRLDGAVSQELRGELLTKFNDPQSEYNLFLLSTRAGGLGLNLQTADTVIIYDSDWNPHQDLQAQDRAHRIGQKKEVRIFRLVTANSVEETILARSRTKLDMDKKIIQGGRFDNKSTEKERDAFLRAILEAGADAENEDDIDLNDDELNEILARGEDEVEIFTQMDLQRKADERADWHARGGRGNPPDRLLSEHELPEIYKRDPVIRTKKDIEEAEAPQYDDTTGRRKRKNRTDIIYDDGLTEDQFANLVDDDTIDIDDGLAAARAKRGRHRLGAYAQDLGSVNGDSDDSQDVGARRRQPGSVAPSIASTEGDERQPKRRKRDSGGGNTMKPFYRSVIEKVEELENPEGFDSCTLFLELPSRTDYPDYYQFIKKPISIKQIRNKVDTNRYLSTAAFRADWQLMIDNAVTYNEPTSNVARDAYHMLSCVDAMLANQQPAQQYGYPSTAPSTEGNTLAFPTPASGSRASTPSAQPPPPQFKIKLGSRLIVDDGDSEDSE